MALATVHLALFSPSSSSPTGTACSALGKVGEWQPRIDLVVRTRREAFQYDSQPARRIKSVEFGDGEQALDYGGAAAGPFRTGEQPVLFADGDRMNDVFNRVAVDRQRAQADIAFQRQRAFKRMVDRPCRCRRQSRPWRAECNRFATANWPFSGWCTSRNGR